MFFLHSHIRKSEIEDNLSPSRLSLTLWQSLARGCSDLAETASGWSASFMPRWVSHQTSCFDTHTLNKTSGGIRGIVELKVLLEVEQELGGKIKIQDFFDLIVGTR